MLVFVSPTIEQQWLRTIKDGWSRYHKNLFGVLLARVHFSVYVFVCSSKARTSGEVGGGRKGDYDDQFIYCSIGEYCKAIIDI